MTGPPEPPCGQGPTVVGQVFGALEPDDEDRITEHLVGCLDCRGVRGDALTVAVALARSVPGVDPPPALRERVLAAARAEPEPPRRPADRSVARTDQIWSVGSVGSAGSVGPDPEGDRGDAERAAPAAGGRPVRRARTALFAVAAAVLVGVVLLAVSAVVPTRSGPDGDPTTQAARAQRIVDGAATRAPGTRHATLRSGDGQPMAVVLDEPTGPRVVPVAMSDPGQGHRYILWAADPGASAVPVATVDPTAGTTVALPGAVAPPSPRAYAVSVEETGPVPPRPTAVVGVGVLV